jgi:hypothetical protein
MIRLTTPRRTQLMIAAATVAGGLGTFAPAALALTEPSVVNLSATEGIPTDASTPIAAFGDGLDPLCSPAADYTATVDWGDGLSSPAAVAADGGSLLGNCDYIVSASHTYATAMGATTFEVVVNSNTGTQTGEGTVTVADQPLSAGPTRAVSAVAGTPFEGLVAAFIDPVPQAPSDYLAVVDWGDGSSSSGTISTDPAGPTAFDVNGRHTYARPGGYTISTTITDESGGAQTTVTSSAAVSAASQSGSGSGTTTTTTTTTSAPTTATSASVPTPPPPAPVPIVVPAPKPKAKPTVRSFTLPVDGITRRAGMLRVAVGCPRGLKLCRGYLYLQQMKRDQVAATIGTELFLVVGGQRAEIDVRPSAAERNRLLKAGRVEIRATAVAADPASSAVGSASRETLIRFGPLAKARAHK